MIRGEMMRARTKVVSAEREINGCHGIVIENKKHIFGLPPLFLEFSLMRAIKVSFVLLMRCLWKSPKDGGWLPVEPTL